MSSAQTLRDYWSGHGHAGPSHGAERDEIAWGTPGDFMRCVAQVTAHGKMTEEQAKGYCNLRHHDALGYYPAQHAKREGKSFMSDIALADQSFERVRTALKAADGGAESRVPPGKATGGQFSVGGDGPSTAPKKPNPYADGKLRPKSKTGGKKTGPKSKSNKPKVPSSEHDSGHTASLKNRRHELRDQLANLYAEKKKLSTTGVSNFGTSATVKPAAKPSAAKPTTSKPSTSTSSSSSSAKKPTLASVNAQIAQVKAQIASLNQQLVQSTSARKSVEPTKIRAIGDGDKDGDGDGLFDADGDGDGAVAVRVKSARNPRDVGTGRFRTFQGEVEEARQALSEGRVSDVVDLLGSARVLARTPQERTIVGDLQAALVRVRHDSTPLTKSQATWLNGRMGEINKVGPHGYSHGWIKAGAPTDTHHTHETGDLPQKLQVGAFNYKRGDDGNYTRHHPSTGNRVKAGIDKETYSPEEVKRMSRGLDYHGQAPAPVYPISSMKHPKISPVPGSLFNPKPIKPSEVADRDHSRNRDAAYDADIQPGEEMAESEDDYDDDYPIE